MKIGKAVAIFWNIDSKEYTDDEKLTAIYLVLGMETHNGTTKEKILKAFRWLFNHTVIIEEGKTFSEENKN